MAAKKRKTSKAVTKKKTATEVVSTELVTDVKRLIQDARQAVAQTVNAALVLLYWQIGQRIRRDILHEERAEYGKQILQTLSEELVLEYGRGFRVTNLSLMIRFAEAFPDATVVAHFAPQLGWSHLVEILPLKDPLQRDFYAQMCRIEHWSVRTLRAKIQSLLYERTALSREPEQLIRQELGTLHQEDRLTPDLVFRDPYVLDFLGLHDSYSEADLEAAILRELEVI